MTPEFIVELMTRATWLAIECAGPILAVGLVVGLTMSLVAAATQLQEPGLTFVPKLLALAASLVAFGPWLLERMVGFTASLFRAIATIG